VGCCRGAGGCRAALSSAAVWDWPVVCCVTPREADGAAPPPTPTRPPARSQRYCAAKRWQLWPLPPPRTPRQLPSSCGRTPRAGRSRRAAICARRWQRRHVQLWRQVRCPLISPLLAVHPACYAVGGNEADRVLPPLPPPLPPLATEYTAAAAAAAASVAAAAVGQYPILLPPPPPANTLSCCHRCCRPIFRPATTATACAPGAWQWAPAALDVLSDDDADDSHRGSNLLFGSVSAKRVQLVLSLVQQVGGRGRLWLLAQTGFHVCGLGRG
jgi:hypothetical protein